MEEDKEGKSNFWGEPGICNSTTKNTFTYQLENILFIKKTGEIIFSGFANRPKFLTRRNFRLQK